MDLDKLKDIWQDAEIKPSITNGEENRLFTFKEQRALNKLQKYENRSFYISIILLVVGIGLTIFALQVAQLINPTIPIFITSTSILLLLWNAYKKLFWQKIDISTTSVIQVSKSIAKYRKYLALENVIAPVWAAIFAIIFVCTELSHLSIFYQIIYALLISIACIVISYIVYKFTIADKLNTINQAINEIEEIEKDNIE